MRHVAMSLLHPAKVRHICKKRNTILKRDLQNTKRETYTYDWQQYAVSQPRGADMRLICEKRPIHLTKET